MQQHGFAPQQGQQQQQQQKREREQVKYNDDEWEYCDMGKKRLWLMNDNTPRMLFEKINKTKGEADLKTVDNVTRDEADSAYKKLSREYHPDSPRNRANPGAAAENSETFKKINDAHERLLEYITKR